MQIPIIRARKPPFGSIPRVNYDNPIAEGIIGCYLPGLMRGQPVIGGVILANGSDGSGERALTRDGIALKTPAGVGNRGLIGTAPANFKSGEAFSIQWRGVLHGNCDSYAQLILITYNTGDDNPYFVWGITTDYAGYTMIQNGWNTGGTGQRTAPHDVSSHYGKMIDLVATFRVNGNSTFYVNGVQAQVSLFGGTPPSSATSQIVIDQYIPGWGRSANASCNIATFWDRELSPSEVQALSTDPYCCLSYPEDEIFATLTGGGGPPVTHYTMAADVGTVTLAGQAAALKSSQWRLVGIGTEVVNTTTTSHTLTVPAGVAAGDLLVAVFSTRIASSTPMTLPTGGEWTLVGEQNNNNILTTQSAAPSGLMAYCVRGTSDPNLVFTHPTTPSQSIGRIIAYSGVDPVTPLDTSTAATTATNTISVSVTGVTTTVPRALLVVAACGGQEAAWSSFDATDPATSSGATNTTTQPSIGGWLERADTSSTVGADGSLGVADAIRGTAGATGNITVTASASAAHVIIVGAFRPITPSQAPYTMPAGLGTLTAAGQPVALRVGRKLAAGLGTITLSGQPATLRYGHKMPAGLGTLTPAGQPAVLRNARKLAAGLGTLTLSGQPAVLRYAHKTAAGLGTLTLSGQPAVLTYSRKIKMAAGLGVLTPAGQAVNLVYSGAGSKTMLAGLGTLTLAGQPVALRYAHRMAAGLGTLTLSGQPATLTYSRKLRMAADLGTLTLSGQPALLRYGHKLAAGLGTLSLAGQPVTLTYSRKIRMTAGLGTITLAGQAATLTKASSTARVMAAGLGTLTIGGQPVTLRYARRMPAGLGTLALSGQPAGLRRAKRLTALVGNINMVGQNAILTYAVAANIRMAADVGTLVLSGQSVSFVTVPVEPGPEPTPLPPSQPGVLKFGRRVTINRW